MGIWGIVATIIAVATAAASYVQQKKLKKQAAKQAAELAAVQVSGHDSNRSLYTIYGETLVGSTTVWKKVSDKRIGWSASGFDIFSQATGTELTQTNDTDSNRFLYRVVALGAGPIEGVTNIIIDGESYNSSRFAQRDSRLHFASAVSDGPVAGRFFTPFNTYSQFANWNSAMTGKAVAYAVERLYLHKKSPAYQGEPSTQYVVKGRKVYDPRKDSTASQYDASLGVSTHRSNDSATWQWSDNPSICLLDYLVNNEYGRGLDYSDIDLDSIASAADKCDAGVSVPARLTNDTGATIDLADPFTGLSYTINIGAVYDQYRSDQDVSNTQKRFRLNMAVDGANEVLDNVQSILNTFRGHLVYANGKYIVQMDDVESSSLSLNDDDIIGGLKISEGDRSQRMNRCTIKFNNKNKQYKTDQVSWPEIGTTEYNTYLAEDQDEKLHKTFTIEGCNDFYQAEDTAEFLVRDSRVTQTVRGKFGPRALGLVPGDVISLTYDSAGFSGKFFRVRSVGLDISTHEVSLELVEYDSSVYTWNANKGNEPLGISWVEEPFNLEPTAPTIGTITEGVITRADGSTTVTMAIPYTDVPEDADSLEVSYKVSSASVYQTVQVLEPEDQTSQTVVVDTDDATYDVRIRYFVTNNNGRTFPSAYDTTTFDVSALTGTALDNFQAGSGVNTFVQASTSVPTAIAAGDIWYTTDTGKQYIATNAGDNQIVTGEWEIVLVVADEIDGQGDLATEDSVDYTTGQVINTPTSLTDINVGEYSSLASITSIPLVIPGGNSQTVTQVGLDVQSSGNEGTSTWSTQFYSKDASIGGCAVTFTVGSTSSRYMIGLNSDPTSNASFSSIDYAWYVRGSGGDYRIYESGTNIQTVSATPTAGDILVIGYDGTTIRYMLNGVVQRSVVPTTQPSSLALDSSIDGIGSQHTTNIKNINFINIGATLPTLGTNVLAEDGSTLLADEDLRNSALDVSTSGATLSVTYGANTSTGVTLDASSNIDNALYYTAGATEFTGEIDATHNSILASAATDPTGQAGEFYYNTTDKEWKYYDGSAWVAVSTFNTGALADKDAVDLGTSEVTGTLGTANADAALINTIDAGDSVDQLVGSNKLEGPTFGAGTLVVSGTSIEKTSASAWNAGYHSAESYVGGMYVTATVSVLSDSIMFGLSDAPQSGTLGSYPSIDYAIFQTQSNTVNVYESGTSIGVVSSSLAVGDQLTVVYDGSRVKYYKNATLLRTVTVENTNQMYAAFSFFSVNSKLRNISYGPVGSTRWGDIAGANTPANNADVTSANTAAGIASQGALATQSSVALGSQVSGTLAQGSGGTGLTSTSTLENANVNLSISGQTFGLSGAGATSYTVNQGNVGLSGVSNNADQTSANTAAGIAGQGALATQSSVTTEQVPANVRGNLQDISGWTAASSTVASGWSTNGGETQNEMVVGLGPRYAYQVLWQANSTSTVANTANGGWGASPGFTPDNTKTYRFAVPIQVSSSTRTGTAYWGIEANTVCDLNTTTVQGNPYFAVLARSSMTTGRWYLFVGYVYPYNTTGWSHTGAGVYDMATGAKVLNYFNFNWSSSPGSVTNRAYMYYCSSTADRQLFAPPIVHLVDGSEPPLNSFFAETAYQNNNLSLSTSGQTLQLNNGGGNTTLAQGNVGLSGVSNNADQTSANTAAGIASQGALATQSSVALGSQVSGTLAQGSGGTGLTSTSTLQNANVNLSISGQTFGLSGAGATSYTVSQGNVGLSGVSNNADQTSANTAAGIASQGALATSNTVNLATTAAGGVSGLLPQGSASNSIRNAFTENGITRVASPLGATVRYNSSNQVGAIKVALPVGWTNSMLSFTVTVYNYSTGTSMEWRIGGYNYAPSTQWYNEYAHSTGYNNYNVRFSHDGSKACVYIGETNSTWQYPQITVKDVQVGYSGETVSNWDDGWACSLVTSFNNSGASAVKTVGDTRTSAQWTYVGGTGTPADNADVTSANTAAAISGQAATATSSDFAVVTGSTRPANNADVTSANTAAGIAGQGSLATSNSVALASQVTGELPVANANVDLRNNTEVGSVTSILSPGGGGYRYNGNITGQIRIFLPAVGNLATMMNFEVDIYNYVTGTSSTYLISGHTSGTTWYQEAASCPNGSLARQVTFGYGSSRWQVGIGATNATWSYPQIRVRNCTFGYANTGISNWDDGWAVDISTSSIAGVTRTVSDSRANANWQLVGGTGVPADNADVTSANTAAAISGQGTLATQNSVTTSQVPASTLNTNVTTYTLNRSPTAVWSALSSDAQISGPTAPYDVTIQWRNGSGTSLGTTVIRMSYSASGTSISTTAHTTQSNGASASVSLNSTNTSSRKVTTVTKNSVTVTLESSVINGISWTFSK